MPTIDDVIAYLGYDEVDEQVKTNISRSIKTADAYLKGAIGKEYPTDDPRAVELALVVIADLYENREMTQKVSGNVRKLVNDFIFQLQIETGGQ